MPHWYSEKKELRLTPSQQAGLPHDTEMRYRREGARYAKSCTVYQPLYYTG